MSSTTATATAYPLLGEGLQAPPVDGYARRHSDFSPTEPQRHEERQMERVFHAAQVEFSNSEYWVEILQRSPRQLG